MTREQYVKVLQRQIEKLNKEIDVKILSGQNYAAEAREHALLRRKMRQHKQANFMNQLWGAFTLQY
jgi:hypothetical protein